MEKQAARNRKSQKIVVVTDIVPNAKGLGFVMHGLGGFKEQAHVQTFAKALKDNGYSVVTFDTTNTFGESDGSYEQATTTNYYEDLEDVIAWAKKQSWYLEPFVLIGHSLGGISTALYAEKHPEEVKALAPISTVVSGALSLEAPSHLRSDKEWKETGWRITESKSKPGVIKKLPWSHIEDRLKYDLLPQADKLTMPVLLMAGEYDESTPFKHQEIFYEALRGPKELHLIKEAGHTFRDQEHLDEIYRILSDWIQGLD